MTDREPLDSTPTIPLPVVRTNAMIDQFKALAIDIVRWAAILTALYLAVCVALMAQHEWTTNDMTGFWRIAGGAGAVALVAVVIARSRNRQPAGGRRGGDW